MTDAIPKWAMQIARETIIDCRKSNTDTLAEFIARAIMAADEAASERAAVISEEFSQSSHIAHSMETGVFPNVSRIEAAIAAAIRKGATHD